MKKAMIIIAACVGIIVSITVAGFFVERGLASKAIHRYIEKQSVELEMIDTWKVYNNVNNGGILIVVRYIDDPDNIYYYHYRLWTNRAAEGLKWNVVNLQVSDQLRVLSAPYEGKCKYPPLIEDYFY